ncbi:SMEK domain-containing protein [Undibacterium sp. Ji67W]|uniref:SMEK domain-containing protein n=1 Tax=Undibacterium sp. Ji67W TaxID=3413042 RepID=UPI003BF04747
MITRGHLIGEIIDELSVIGEQVKLRCGLGLTDLTVYAENFFRDVLNALHSIELKNLNDTRSNEPGLDLGDEKNGWGFQITATPTSAKVNHTLEKITPAQTAKYKNIRVLILGKRQTQYTIDPTFASPIGFEAEHIWDITTLARDTVALPIDRLDVLHRVIRSNAARLRVELEIPDDSGKYPTSGYDKWEARPVPVLGSGAKFKNFFVLEYESDPDEFDNEELAKDIRRLAKTLSRLPRITREFLATLYERRERKKSKRSHSSIHATVILGKMEREYRGDDFHGEVALLDQAGLLNVDTDDIYELGPAEIILTISRNDDLASGFFDFVEKNGYSYRKIIGEVDFSVF